MRVEVLQYLQVIAEAGSISKAAEQINIQQTTLSAAVRALEAELGYPIFLRTSSGVTLTGQGREMMKLSVRMLEDYERMKDLGRQGSTELFIYTNTFIYSKFYSDIYIPFSKQHPQLKVSVFKLLPETYLKQSGGQGAAHRIGIESIPAGRLASYIQSAERMGYTVEPVTEMRAMAYLNRANPLSRRKAVSFDMLRDDKIMVGIQMNTDELRERYGLSNIAVVDGADLIRLIWLVNSTDAVGLFPEYNAVPREAILDSFTEVVPLPIEGGLDLCPIFVQCMVYPKDTPPSPEERAFLALTRSVLKDAGHPIHNP